jgi:hypothetical protein
MNRHAPVHSLRSTFGWPLAIFMIGIAGLIIALTGDGWRDAAAWAALAAPVAAVIWAMRARRS